ncbi:MAG: ATP synthase F1 subunit gamma, partial [Sphingopyxis sp.]|nr:ATP synthase F1 subunit gamma [Sphingopyxis sp.]
LAGSGKSDTHLLVVLNSDRGLAGAFNSNIVKAARDKAYELQAQGKTVRFFLVGRKGRPVIARLFPGQIVEQYDTTGFRNIGFEQANEIAAMLMDMFDAGAFDVAHVFYSKFRSALLQEATGQQMIPVAPPADAPAASDAAVEYEPGEEEILADLLPRNVSIQIFKGLLENAASEQGASMTAMDNATRNAGDLINRLTIVYNRQRQAAITTELVEIIAGAEAL